MACTSKVTGPAESVGERIESQLSSVVAVHVTLDGTFKEEVTVPPDAGTLAEVGTTEASKTP